MAAERLKVAAVLAAACALAACGRAGPLELPPGPAVGPSPTAQATPPAAAAAVGSGPTANETAMKNGFDANGNPVAPPGQKKSFVLDPLLQ